MREVSFRDHQNYMYYTNIMANAWGVSQYLVGTHKCSINIIYNIITMFDKNTWRKAGMKYTKN